MSRRAPALIAAAALALAAAPAAGGASGSCGPPKRLPNRGCTPGETFAFRTSADVCVPGYSSRVRNVPAAVKADVYRRYGITHHRRGQYEVDHLIPLELGGDNSERNLWPEAADPRPGFHEKDKLENRLHDLVCGGSMSLGRAQRLIARDWLSAYRRYG